jgi:LysM repeat protein/uncharacterized protein YvpB
MRRALCAVLILGVLGAAPAVAQDGENPTHVVQPGENLFRVALRYGVTVDAIMAANSLTNRNLVYAGQVLIIPLRSEGTAAGPSAPAPMGTASHAVARGETLFSLARRYGVSVSAIMQANGVSDPNRIYVGQVLTIPVPASGGTSVRHTVAPGETLWRIARRYGVGVNAIIAANGIANPNRIYAGQVLTILGVSGPVASDRVYLDVPIVRQSRNMSCESASACSLMRYMGYPCAGDMTVFNALPRSYDNPHRGYVGPMDGRPGSLPPGAASSWVGGYGVYVEPLHASLSGLGVASHYTYFASLSTLRDLISQGVPVMIIATHGLGIYGYGPTYFAPTDGDGGTVTVIRYEHSYALIGYDAGGFWAIDPWSGSVDYYTDARIDADWARLGRQALWVTRQ